MLLRCFKMLIHPICLPLFRFCLVFALSRKWKLFNIFPHRVIYGEWVFLVDILSFTQCLLFPGFRLVGGGFSVIWMIYRYLCCYVIASEDVRCGGFPAHVGYAVESSICQIPSLFISGYDISSRVPLFFVSF